MTHQCVSGTLLLKATAAINILGNFLGAAASFIFFVFLEPRLNSELEMGAAGVQDRAIFFLSVILLTIFIIAPINSRLIIRLYRQIQDCMRGIVSGESKAVSLEELRTTAGKLLGLPVKLAGTTMIGWIISAIVVASLPHLAPTLFPWPHQSSHKIAAWLVLVSAPITILSVYFVQEGWLRFRISSIFPREVLSKVPPTFHIDVFPRLLVAFLLVSILPVATITHITLHQVNEIHAGRQSIQTFLNAMPAVVGFLVVIFGFVAVGLSLIVSKSFSQPLKNLEVAMKAAGDGDLEIRVPVVSNDEIGTVAEGFNRMVQDQEQLASIKDIFGRYVSREVVSEILKSSGGMDLTGEIREITILVADLRGFTRIAESLQPQEVLRLINRFLQRMTDIILQCNGTIDEFTGDGILVFFGAPRPMEDHSLCAVTCALEMQEAMKELNSENLKLGFPKLQMGIGINRGELIVGNIGSEKRKKYGAVGSPINIAFRIEAETKGGEVLISQSVLDTLESRVMVEKSSSVLLKGFDKPVTIHRIISKSSLEVSVQETSLETTVIEEPDIMRLVHRKPA
jgi:sigma-B regulation protein RsbU (phosphoserine phosphatase)